MKIAKPIVKDLSKFDERVDTITAETSFSKVKHVISDIKKTLYDNKDIPALCAPQIGESLRLFVVKNGKRESNRFKVFLNPMTVSAEGWHLSREISPSIPNKQYIIPRRDKIHVAFQASDGQVTSETFIGPYGEVVQQMIEMLDGITLADYGLDLDDLGGPEAFDAATDKEKTEVLALYMDHLKDTLGELNAEINADENLKYLNDLIDFRTEVLKGNIKPIDENGNIVDDEYIKTHAKEIAEKRVAEMKERMKEEK